MRDEFFTKQVDANRGMSWTRCNLPRDTQALWLDVVGWLGQSRRVNRPTRKNSYTTYGMLKFFPSSDLVEFAENAPALMYRLAMQVRLSFEPEVGVS